MKKEKLFNWLFVLSVLVSGLSFASCSDDDDFNDNDTPPVVDVPNPAGDDFYMYVNGEWHENLTDTETTQGYWSDIEAMLSEMTDYAYENMEEYQMVMKSLAQMENGGNEANEQRVEEIIAAILADVETEYDAYVAIGKCIGMGLMDNTLKLYTAYENGKIRYTLGPIDAEDKLEEKSYARKRFRHIKYTKPALMTRGGGELLKGILEGLGMNPEYFVYEKNFVDETFELLASSSLEELTTYIQNNIRVELMPYCRDEYVGQVTAGAITSTAEFLQAMRDDLFNYSISYMFNQLYISEEVKAQFEVYGEELRSVFAKRIENNSWLSVETKAAAQDKLSKMNFFYGGPDEWLAEGFPAPEGELLVDDILELKASRTRMIAAIMDQSLFTESMNYMMFAPGGLSLNLYNAIYIVENNSVNIFPALMMKPEWSEEMDPAEMYATFQVIGHEITHGFDKDGSAVDAYGEENNWWTAEDKEKFLALNDKLSAQISTFEVAPGILTDGERTIAEDVADLGGLNIAFDAMNEFMKESGVTGEALKEAQKRFFKRYAQRLCINYSADELEEMFKDEHSVGKIRVNGMLQHMDAWYNLYNVVEGDSLYLPAEERVLIW